LQRFRSRVGTDLRVVGESIRRIAAFKSREPSILRRFSALLCCLRAVIRGELSIPCRLRDDLLEHLPRIAGNTRYQSGHCRIPLISGPVTLIGHLIASEGGNIPIVCRRIPRRRD
jgi:hypothetical protein